MEEPIVIYEKRDPHIAIIRLNRPEKKNSISRELHRSEERRVGKECRL